jgi:hypothetical protein
VSVGLAVRATVAGIQPSAIFPPESAIGMLDAVGVVVGLSIKLWNDAKNVASL